MLIKESRQLVRGVGYGGGQVESNHKSYLAQISQVLNRLDVSKLRCAKVLFWSGTKIFKMVLLHAAS